MKKYLFIILLIVLYPLVILAENSTNDFEAELLLLETKDLVNEEKAEALVEKMSAQNNSTREDDLVLDNVSLKNSANKRDPPLSEVAPISQESIPIKKTRRIPSR